MISIRRHYAGREITPILLCILALVVLVSAWAWQQRRLDVLIGFLLGVTTSIFYVLLLYWQIKVCINLPAEEFASSLHSGWLVRLTLALALLAISRLWPQISFPAAFFGFFCFQTGALLYGTGVYVYRIITGIQYAE